MNLLKIEKKVPVKNCAAVVCDTQPSLYNVFIGKIFKKFSNELYSPMNVHMQI